MTHCSLKSREWSWIPKPHIDTISPQPAGFSMTLGVKDRGRTVQWRDRTTETKWTKWESKDGEKEEQKEDYFSELSLEERSRKSGGN